MKKFEDILESWAMKYKPMKHIPGETSTNKRLFLFDSIVSIPDFMTRIGSNLSPCLGYEFPMRGSIKGGKVLPVYTIYFLVKQDINRATGKELSAEANQEALQHAFKFIAWMKEQQELNPELRNIDLDEVSYDTYGPLYNGWYGIFIQIRDVDKFNQCVDKSDYIE